MQLNTKQLTTLLRKTLGRKKLTPALDSQPVYTTVGELHRAIIAATNTHLSYTTPFPHHTYKRGQHVVNGAPNSYSPQIKRALKKLMTPDTNLSQLAREHNINVRTLYRWRKES